MMAPAHILTSLTTTGVVFGSSPVLLTISAVSAILPDIDLPDSKIGKMVPIIPSLIGAIFGHRTITHSLIPPVIGYGLLSLFGKEIALAWAIGYGSHILLDMLTPMGVMLLWPLPISFGFGLINTKGITEALFTIGLFLFHVTSTWGQQLWLGAGKNLVSSLFNIFF